MSRRIAATLVALTIATGGLTTACGKANHADDTSPSQDTILNGGGVSPSASASTTFKQADFGRTASFDGTQNSAKGGNSYTVTVQLGKSQSADPDLTVTPDNDVTSPDAINLGVAMNGVVQDDAQDDRRCINSERDTVIPIDITVNNGGEIGGTFPLNTGVRDKNGQSIPPLKGLAISMIYRQDGEITCDTNAGVAEVNSLPKVVFKNLDAGGTGELYGFLVLHNTKQRGAGLYADYSLQVDTIGGNDILNGYDKVGSLTGFDGTAKTTITGGGEVPVGGLMRLVK